VRNFRDCDLRQVKITDSWLTDVRGVRALFGSFRSSNDVDVTGVSWRGSSTGGTPERVQLRTIRTADD